MLAKLVSLPDYPAFLSNIIHYKPLKHTRGWVDAWRWMLGQSYSVTQKGQQRYSEMTVDSDGQVFIRDSSDLPRRGRIPVGYKFIGNRVLGYLRPDQNLGTIYAVRQANDRHRPVGDLLRVVYRHPLTGQLREIGPGMNPQHTLGWLDIRHWFDGAQVTPRSDQQKYAYYPVSKCLSG
jgi:hypothetical protein